MIKVELLTIKHPYDFGTVELTMSLCGLGEDEARLSEQTETLWVSVAELPELEMAPAGVPMAELLLQRL